MDRISSEKEEASVLAGGANNRRQRLRLLGRCLDPQIASPNRAVTMTSPLVVSAPPRWVSRASIDRPRASFPELAVVSTFERTKDRLTFHRPRMALLPVDRKDGVKEDTTGEQNAGA
jgi:hypothetical protein